jgi:recombination protein RecA
MAVAAAPALLRLVPAVSAFRRDELAGRMVEISGRGAVSCLSAAAALVLEAQSLGEPCAWVAVRDRAEASTFFPPDLARFGVDLEALPVVFAPSPQAAARAAARLLRSGAFGLLVLDLGREPEISIALQGRLTGLALKHDAAVVLLTEKPARSPSIGSMVSLRAEPRRSQLQKPGTRAAAQDESLYRVTLAVLKDKRRGPGWTHEEVMLGPDGLR